MFIKYNALALVWAGIVLVLTLTPGDSMPETFDWEFFRFDTLAHFFVFGLLTFLFVAGFKKQDTFKRFKANPIFSAISVSILYGVLIEIVQGRVPGRYFELGDILANSLGCVVGGGIYYLMLKKT